MNVHFISQKKFFSNISHVKLYRDIKLKALGGVFQVLWKISFECFQMLLLMYLLQVNINKIESDMTWNGKITLSTMANYP